MAMASIDHLLDVGTHKAMGLLTLKEVRVLGYMPESICQRFNDHSTFIVKHIKVGDTMWGDVVPPEQESIAVACLPMLHRLLEENKVLVQEVGWPIEAEQFFAKSFEEFVLRSDSPRGAELQDLIKRAYNHPPF